MAQLVESEKASQAKLDDVTRTLTASRSVAADLYGKAQDADAAGKAKDEQIGSLQQRLSAITGGSVSQKWPRDVWLFAGATRKPKDRFKDEGCPGGCPEMVVLSSGSFKMGSPKTDTMRSDNEGAEPFTVQVREPFAIGRFHVTVAEYRAFAEDTKRAKGVSCFAWGAEKWVEVPGKSWEDPGFLNNIKQTPRHPVVCTSWFDAVDYTNWLNAKIGRKLYRLPTEAELEYAIRGGRETRWWWGDDANKQCESANGVDLSYAPSGDGVAKCDDHFQFTNAVDELKENGFDLKNISGNAWQWAQDCSLVGDRKPALDASLPTDNKGCNNRATRGGGWRSSSASLRAARRAWGPAAERHSDQGFRVVRISDP
jgi:formylglycine-generating enzyme required for sulfatase activity